jgi:hypothetical protein
MAREPPRQNEDGSTTEVLATATIREDAGGTVVITRINGGGALLSPDFPTSLAARAFVDELRTVLAQSVHAHHAITRNPRIGSTDERLVVALDATVQAHAAAFAERLVAGELNRPLLAEIVRFLHFPAMADRARLAWLLKSLHDRVCDTKLSQPEAALEAGRVTSDTR